MDGQPRITDLIPRSYLSVSLLFLLGLTGLAGLEALYAWMPELAAATTDGRVAAFDLDGEGSLAAWFSSTTLMVAGLVALIIYSVRRQREDDYHAKYRVWLWAAGCWFLMGIDEASSLHEGFKGMMAWLTDRRLFGDGSIWWVMAYGLVLGILGLRLLREMKVCRSATVVIVAAAATYVLAVTVQLDLLLPRAGARTVMLEEGSEMLGNLLLCLAMVLHARYVINESHGPAAGSATRKETKPTRKTRSVHSKTAGVDGPHGSATTPRKTTATRMSAASSAARDSADDPSPTTSQTQKLTKAQRKALRKQKQRERQMGLR